mmetsp:Transcript_25717/g.74304  ORF Transcript_25717/g.74304 Transcript_25717/m.74304 type:complete len:225 (+) Transcript_25717:1158-1832(+)
MSAASPADEELDASVPVPPSTNGGSGALSGRGGRRNDIVPARPPPGESLRQPGLASRGSARSSAFSCALTSRSSSPTVCSIAPICSLSASASTFHFAFASESSAFSRATRAHQVGAAVRSRASASSAAGTPRKASSATGRQPAVARDVSSHAFSRYACSFFSRSRLTEAPAKKAREMGNASATAGVARLSVACSCRNSENRLDDRTGCAGSEAGAADGSVVSMW